MQRLLAFGTLLAACVPAAFFVDISVAQWARAGHLPGELKNLIRLSEVFAQGSGILLVLLAVLAIDPRAWRVLPRLSIAAYGAGLTVDVLKIAMGRIRPANFDLALPVWNSFRGPFPWRATSTLPEAFSWANLSFPSGHAATATGLACALSRLYPRGAWVFALFTLLACLQRIQANAHYLSDVLAGAVVGILFNALLERPQPRKLLESLEADRNATTLDVHSGPGENATAT